MFTTGESREMSRFQKSILFMILLVCVEPLLAQMEKKSHTLTIDEARKLVRSALPKETTDLPGFGLDYYKDAYFPDLYFFEGQWNNTNPRGSVVINHFAVNPRTGDICEPILWKPITSPELKELQKNIRKRLRLSNSEYLSIKKKGPC
jgi:hypothetical protein